MSTITGMYQPVYCLQPVWLIGPMGPSRSLHSASGRAARCNQQVAVGTCRPTHTCTSRWRATGLQGVCLQGAYTATCRCAPQMRSPLHVGKLSPHKAPVLHHAGRRADCVCTPDAALLAWLHSAPRPRNAGPALQASEVTYPRWNLMCGDAAQVSLRHQPLLVAQPAGLCKLPYHEPCPGLSSRAHALPIKRSCPSPIRMQA